MSMPPPKNRLDVNKLHLFSIPHKGTGGSGIRSASADVKQLSTKPANSSAVAAPGAGANSTLSRPAAGDAFRREVSSASKRSISSADVRQKIKDRMQKPPSIPVARGGAAAEKMTPTFMDEFWQKRERRTTAPTGGIQDKEKENVPRFASASRSAPLKPSPKLTTGGKLVEPKKIAPAAISPPAQQVAVAQSPNVKTVNRPLSPAAQVRPPSPNAARKASPSTHNRPVSPSPAVKQTQPTMRKPSPKPVEARLSSPARIPSHAPANAARKKEGDAAVSPQAAQTAKRPVLAQRKVIVGSGNKPKPKPKHTDPVASVFQSEEAQSDLVVFTTCDTAGRSASQELLA